MNRRQDELLEKRYILHKICEIRECHDIYPTQHYTLNSDIREMKYELRLMEEILHTRKMENMAYQIGNMIGQANEIIKDKYGVDCIKEILDKIKNPKIVNLLQKNQLVIQ